MDQANPAARQDVLSLIVCRRRCLLALGIAVGSLSMIGCQRTLFMTDEERSQFSRYNSVREQEAPPYLEDEFGRRRPNLRGRLAGAR
jgi:hypothetical protein